MTLAERVLLGGAIRITQLRPASDAGLHAMALHVIGNLLCELGDGFKLAMEWIGRGRYVIPSQAIGAAERLLQMALDYARERRTFGKRIGDHMGGQTLQQVVTIHRAENRLLMRQPGVDAADDVVVCLPVQKPKQDKRRDPEQDEETQREPKA